MAQHGELGEAAPRGRAGAPSVLHGMLLEAQRCSKVADSRGKCDTAKRVNQWAMNDVEGSANHGAYIPEEGRPHGAG